jgi:hypothetical protein
MWKTIDSGIWLRETDDGRFWIPIDTNGVEEEIDLALRRARFRGDSVDIFINTNSGGVGVWSIAEEMERMASIFQVRTHTCYHAISAGLFILAAGSPGCRTAHPNTRFIFHGSGSPTPSAKRLDGHRCEFMERHSNKRADFWWEFILEGKNLEFDVEEASRLGIVDVIDEKCLWSCEICE